MARPVKYTKQVFDAICERIADGISLNKVCSQENMPKKITFYEWLRLYPELSTQYTHAKQDRADTYADELIDIADTEEDINRAKIRIDARKWVACKLHPRNYGEKSLIGLGSHDEVLDVSVPQRQTQEEWEKAQKPLDN